MKTIISSFITLALAILLGQFLIPALKKLKFGQNIRGDAPDSHKKKSGTPTVGGLIFIIPALIMTAPALNVDSIDMLFKITIVPLSIILFGIIGVIDDMLKIRRKNNLGLRAFQKLILIIIASLVVGLMGMKASGTSILVPFAGFKVNLFSWYLPFIVLYFTATTNAVNLTDGVDGLASSVTIIVFLVLALISMHYSSANLAYEAMILASALFGFLLYNRNPAKVFMGDTGSLALGGAVAAIAMVLQMPLLIIILGMVYLLEVLSVILQVCYFKLTGGNRLLKMSPLHHHLEMCGWSEKKIVNVFIIAASICGIIAYISML